MRCTYGAVAQQHVEISGGPQAVTHPAFSAFLPEPGRTALFRVPDSSTCLNFRHAEIFNEIRGLTLHWEVHVTHQHRH